MLNEPLAHFLGLDPEAMRSREGVEALAGNRPIAGSEPLAMAYAGHQFGVFVPSLGDGRALWLGEVEARDGLGYELHARARARRASPAAGMGGPRSGRWCGSTSAARRWRRSGYRAPGRWPCFRPARQSGACAASRRAASSSASRARIFASEASSISPTAAMSGRWPFSSSMRWPVWIPISSRRRTAHCASSSA